MEPYIKGNVSEITYRSELILDTIGNYLRFFGSIAAESFDCFINETIK